MGRRRALTTEDLVAMAEELPDVVLRESAGWTGITFRGKGFAWVDHAEERVMIKGHHDERDALLATAPEVYSAGWQSRSTAWVLVDVPRADPEEVRELLEEGWRMTATQKAVRALEESRATGSARTG